MENSVFRISLDVHRQTTQAHLAVKKGDTARTIIASLSDGGKPYKIEDGCSAIFMAQKPDSNVLYNACRIENNRIVYDFTEQTVSAAGRVIGELRLYGTDEKLITSPRIAITVSGTVYDDDEVESTSEFTALSQAMTDIAELKKNGLKGDPGDSIELRYQDRLVQWRTMAAEGEPEDEWKVLFSSDEVSDQMVQETLDQAKGYADGAAASAKNAAAHAEAASDRAQDAYDDSMASKEYAEQAASYADQARQSAEDANVPEALPNPQKLILIGAVEAEYDGSGEVKVEIPLGLTDEDNARLNANDRRMASLVRTNLFNRSTRSSGFISWDGSIRADDSYYYSDLIPVIPGESYTTQTVSHKLGAQGCRVFLYDVSGAYVTRVDGAQNADGSNKGIGLENATFTVTIPQDPNICYARINGYTGAEEQQMFVRGKEFPNRYYGYMETVATYANALSPLYGKKASFNGDSICNGAGILDASGALIGRVKSYAWMIGDDYCMTVENLAVSGGTITPGQVNASGGKRHSISATVADMDATADYFIVEGGVNDAAISVSLGTITAGYDAELDTTTYCGAFENMCKQLITRFAGKKVGYIAVHKMTAKYNSGNTESSYYHAAKAICEKWGVPFLDLNVQVPPLNYVDSLKTAYTNDGDGWHPNEAGYRAFYVPKIVAWMESL